ncbi:MAG: hypothetical protein HZA90_26605 [Verrucomicrobia bacterium]|nr:hypothetical protein [Verrucomicrobiota bacterium]
MNRNALAGLLSGALLASTALGLWADIKDNPYQVIVTRNAFALKPPPDPASSKPAEPPPSPVEVNLTGISTLSGIPKVLLQITDKSPGKGKTEFPPPLVAGDQQGRIEVVSIDVAKGAVVIKIDGSEKTLTFEKDAPKPSVAAAPPVMPPNPFAPAGTVPLPGMLPQFPGAAAAANPASSSSVTVGGNTAIASPTVTPRTAIPGLGSAALGGATATPYPSRPLRMDAGGVMVGGAGGTTTPQVTPQAQAAPAMTREQAIMHVNEQKALISEAEKLGLIPKNRFPPLPPTPGWPPSGTTPPQGP